MTNTATNPETSGREKLIQTQADYNGTPTLICGLPNNLRQMCAESGWTEVKPIDGH